MKGPKPSPTRLKVIAGNPGRRPLPSGEPTPRRGIPEMPEFLGEIARKKWDVLVLELDRIGLLTVIDGDVLAAYCTAWEEFEEATTLIAKEGRTCMGGSGGLKIHPATTLQRTAWKAIRDFAALFGLEPSSRTRLRLPGSDGEEDPFAAFLENRQA